MSNISPKLLVPILVDALVVDDALNDKEAKSWARAKSDYKHLQRFQPIEPHPTARSGAAQTGVHLQWILPDALCKATSEGERMNFPVVPNRWSVTRIFEEFGQIQTKTWVILSDFLEENPTSESNFLKEKNGNFEFYKIGKVLQLADYQADNKDEALFLTAIGSGDATFQSFTVNSNNVFSFIDQLEDVANQSHRLAYLVTGWYSNPNQDPILAPTDSMEDLLASWHRFNFTLSRVEKLEQNSDESLLKAAETAFTTWASDRNLEANSLIPNMLCHGVIYGVDWKGKAGDLATSTSGKPDVMPDLIIANSGFDAVVRLIQKELARRNLGDEESAAKVVKLLEAFEHNLLRTVGSTGGLAALERATHQSWFTSESGGIFWVIEPTSEIEDFFETIINTGLDEDLNRLNELQMKLEEAIGKRASTQTKWYGVWVEARRNPQDETLQKELETFDTTAFEVVERLVAERDRAKDALLEKLNLNFGTTATLKEKMRAKFWEANEPVVLVHAAKSSDKYGFNSTLTCRYTGQTISSLTEHYSRQVVDFQVVTNENFDNLPIEVLDLIRETVFLNPDFAGFLQNQLTVTGESTVETLRKQQSLIWNSEIYPVLDTDILTREAGFIGKRPALRAFSKALPTWSPLFLDWEVEFYPTDLTPWKLSGYDFEWATNLPEDLPTLTFSGRSLLTSQESKILKNKLSDFKETLPTEAEKKVIEEVIEIIGNFDIVTQRLSGFNEALLGLDINNLIPLATPNADLKSNLTNANLAVPMVSASRHPIRSGFFKPTFLRITDDFGLAIYPLDEANNQISSILKATGCDNSLINVTNILQLPPRITQPARLEVTWTGAKSNKRLELTTTENPVVGWVLPDHLDKSLEFFAADGTALGELITLDRGGRKIAQWLPRPGKNPPSIDHDDLDNFVQSIIVQPNSGLALAAFLREIDASLWTADPFGEQTAQGVSVLIGRPLALVKATIELSVKGFPTDETLVNTAFPIQIGSIELPQNGLLGYFKNQNFNHFYTLNAKTTEHDFVLQAALETIRMGQPMNFTALLDPQGALHLISGILPIVELRLPSAFRDEPINNMEVTFRTGPLLTDPDALRMPKPSDLEGKLTWLQQSGLQVWTEIDDIKTAEQQAHFAKRRQELKDGWLKLSKFK